MKTAVHLVFVLMSLVRIQALENIKECISSNGVKYRGTQQRSSSDSVCLNWNITTRDYDLTHHADVDTGIGDHNFCRNPDGTAEPWCYISGADGQLQREACTIDPCQDQSTTEAPLSSEPTAAKTDIGKQVKSILPREEGAAMQPVVGVSQRVRTGPKKKKDLGTLGYVIAIVMMAIIIVLGVGITLGYFYKRGRDLKKHHEQRVYEREMHRITLPLSAFTNPTCELVDENTIVIAAEPAEPTVPQCNGEGNNLLTDPAGTPGA